MTVGSLLREQREKLGYSLPELSGYLHIRLPYLLAIENDFFDELPPGSAYRIGFIKSYASILQLDTDGMVELFRKEQAHANARQPLVIRRPITDSHVPTFSLIFIIVALFAAGWVGWSYMHRSDRTLADDVPNVPDRLQPASPVAIPAVVAATPVPVEMATAAPATADATAQPATAASGTPAPPSPDSDADEAVDDDTSDHTVRGAEAQPSAAAPTGIALNSDVSASRVEIRATAASWVQIRNPSKIVYTGVMRPGDSYRVPDQPGWSMVAGNAGGITLVIDGTPGQPLGAAGQVAKNVSLDAAKITHP